MDTNQEKSLLSFRTADFSRDWDFVLACGERAWLAVYGNLKRYNPDFFKSNTEAIYRLRADNVILASVGGVNAGICILDSRVEEEEQSGHISLLYLEPQFRGCGYGTQLIAYAEEVCRARGAQQIRLFVAVVNHRARRFYAKCGYAKYGQQFPLLSGQLVLRKELQ